MNGAATALRWAQNVPSPRKWEPVAGQLAIRVRYPASVQICHRFDGGGALNVIPIQLDRPNSKELHEAGRVDVSTRQTHRFPSSLSEFVESALLPSPMVEADDGRG
jgi:hypothetical protein